MEPSQPTNKSTWREPDDVDLERLYGEALSGIEGLLDTKYGLTDDEAIQVDDMVVQLRVWGIELDTISGTLQWLEKDYLNEAAAVRVNLQAVQSSLTNITAHMLRGKEGKGEAMTDNAETSNPEDVRVTMLNDLTQCVERLCGLSESLQIVISLHTKQGLAARVKEFMNARRLTSTFTEPPVSAIRTSQEAESKMGSEYAVPGVDESSSAHQRVPAYSSSAPKSPHASLFQVPDPSMSSYCPILLVTGPVGSGKSTIARYLASRLGFPFLESDEFYPSANVDKISARIPLTDADQWDWLIMLRQEIVRLIDAGNKGVVLAFPALKRKYRDVVRVAPYPGIGVRPVFLYLDVPEDSLLKRVLARQNSMSASLGRAQVDIIEPPMDDEDDVITIDASAAIDKVTTEALEKVIQACQKKGMLVSTL